MVNLTSSQVISLGVVCAQEHFTNVRVMDTSDGIVVQSNPLKYLQVTINRYYRIHGNGDIHELPSSEVAWLFNTR